MANTHEEPPLPPYDASRPFVQQVAYEDGSSYLYTPLWDVSNEDNHHSAEFRLTGNSRRSGGVVEPNALAFSELFLPDFLLDQFAECTNEYAAERLPESFQVEVTRAELLRFFAIYYYMGIVRLPNKKDYWRGGTEDVWPIHAVCRSLSRTRFEYIWRNIHLTPSTEADDETNINEEPGPEDMLEEDFSVEAVEEQDEDEEQDRQKEYKWYHKAAPLVEHVNQTSKRICIRPSSRLSIDEMMKKFKGRSGQTCRMKNKPVKEGFKFFSLCDVESGYVFDMIPDGRLAKSTIFDTVMMLVTLIPDQETHNYVIGMDNYFTWSRVCAELTSLNIGFVGTARFQRGWPPKEVKTIQDNRFNSLYLLNDKGGYRIARWIDNNVVTMVTNVHSGYESITRSRKRPRQTPTNRNHVASVWGEDAVKDITIPCIIDDYNHWMNGVDKADQLIAYYRPSIRCRRTWMPLMFHTLDISRVNATIAAVKLGYKSTNGNEIHKSFIMDYIKALLARATSFEVRSTRRRLAINTPSPTASSGKRRPTSTKNPRLPDERLFGDASEHIRVDAPQQGTCRMCSYLHFKARSERSSPVPKIRRPAKWCRACEVHLCTHHFALYHRP